MKPKRYLHLSLASAFAMCVSASSAATTVYWDALAGNNSKLDPGNGTWGSSSFWNSSSTGAASPGAWGNNDIASFSVSGTNVITMGANIGATGITFAAGTTTIGTVGDGKQITLGTTGMAGGGGNGTINTNLVFGGNQDWTLSGGTGVYVYGVISGNYGYTTHNTTGGVTYYYNTANTYTGNTNVSGGPLHVAVLADGGSSSSIGTGTLSFSRSGGGGTGSTGTCTLTIDGTNATGCSTNRLFTITSISTAQTTAAIYNNGSGAVNFTNTGSLTMTGAYAHGLQLGGSYTGAVNTFAPIIANPSGSTTSFTKSNDASTWALTGANTYTGTTTISGGTLQIGNGGASGALASGTAITDNANLAFDRTDSYGGSYSNAITGSGTLTVLAGTLTLAGTYGNSGGFVINSGATVIMANNNEVSSIPLTVYGTLNFDNGQIFGVLNGSGTITENTNWLYTNSSSNGSFSGTINGNGGYIKQGTGTEILSGSNGFTGGVGIYGGTVQLGSGGALNSTAGLENSVTFGSSTTGTLALCGNSVTVSSLTGSAGGPVVENAIGSGVLNATLTVGNSTNVGGTFAGVIQDGSGGGTLALTKAGSGTLTLSGANTYTGATTINAGTLDLSNQNAAQNSTLVMSGGSLVFDSSVSGSAFTLAGLAASNSGAGYDIVLQNNAGTPAAIVLTVGGNNASTTYAGVLSGAGSLSKTGSGTLTLSAANTYTGATTINTGTLDVTGSLASGSTVEVGTAGTLSGTGTVNGNTTLTGGGVINLGIGGILGGTLVVTGGNWNGAGGVNGLVTSSSGTFTIGSGANLTANGGLNVTGGTLSSGGSTATITGSINYTGSSNSAFGGVIAGSGSALTLNNLSATWTLSGANTYGGATTVSNGTLSINTVAAGAAAQSLGEGGTVNLGVAGTSSGTLVYTGTGGTLDKTINVLGNGLDSIHNTGSGLLTISGTIANNGTTVTLGGTGAITVGGTGTIAGLGAGASNLIVSGTGLVTLSTSNSYDGTTTVNAGSTLEIANGNALGGTGAGTTVVSGGVLELSGDITVGAEALSISGTGIANGGTLCNISGTNTYVGVVTLAADSRINSDAGNLWLTGGIGGAHNLTIGGVGNTVVSSAISTGTLAKDGTGILMLSDSNPYTGNTTVSEGTLALSGAGSIASSPQIAVAAGATLDVSAVTGGNWTLGASQTLSGAGTVSGVFTVNASGTIHPDGTATLSTTGAATISGTYTCDINATASGKLAVGGELTLSGASLNLNALAAPAASSYTIATYGSLSGTFAGLAEGASVTVGTATYIIKYADGGNNITLSLPPASGFGTWIGGFAGLSDSTPGGNPSGDGISNLMKYVLNGDPRVSDPSILPSQTEDGSGNLVFTFHRQHQSAGDTTQIFQYGTDLAIWADKTVPPSGTSGNVVVTADTPTAGTDEVVVTLPTNGAPLLFARLKVTQP